MPAKADTTSGLRVLMQFRKTWPVLSRYKDAQTEKVAIKGPVGASPKWRRDL